MVKKMVYHKPNEPYEDDANMSETPEYYNLINLNDAIHKELVIQKNNITGYHKSKKWDKYKKISNEYELIFTSTQGFPSIAKKVPISRSYFKLWEILIDLSDEMGIEKHDTIKACFLADAPGGFVEAFINYRGRKRDDIYGISLQSHDKVVPQWRLPYDFQHQHNIKLYHGENGSGNLYEIKTIHDFVNRVGRSTCQFITADGGFDFSSDFNNQEEMSLQLIVSEIYTALLLQQTNGTFILKMYDLNNIHTIKLLYILNNFYKDMYFIKPLTSRPANSEKYVVCTGFFKNDMYDSFIEILHSNITDYNTDVLLNDIDVPLSFLQDIVNFNSYYVSQQIAHIVHTFSLIENSFNDDNKIKEIIKLQIKKALKWCHKYKIECNLQSIQRYKPYYCGL
jgi:23S rRNA U2552 (ribose-2'-O)-methylase RlmE/FtsJ